MTDLTTSGLPAAPEPSGDPSPEVEGATPEASGEQGVETSEPTAAAEPAAPAEPTAEPASEPAPEEPRLLPAPIGAAAIAETPAPAVPSPAILTRTPASVTPASVITMAPASYGRRFALVYGMLGALTAAAVVGLVFGILAPTHRSTAWSGWAPPSGSTSQMESAIATHVAAQYHLDKAGAQLVAVVSGPPQVTSGTHKVSISAIAVRKTPNSNTGIQIFSSSGTWTDELCGLGPSCSISSGQPTQLRGRLVRREALEVALYTFKFVPSVSALVAYMPPPAGATSATLLYFQRSQYDQQLSQPLAKTLPLIRPPLPTAADSSEAPTIDKLTLPDVFSYSLTALQDGSAALVLDPVLS